MGSNKRLAGSISQGRRNTDSLILACLLRCWPEISVEL